MSRYTADVFDGVQLKSAAMTGEKKDAAMNINDPKNNFGGIDMNSANLAMTIKRDGKGVPLPLAQQDMAQLSRIQGFVPVIIEIKSAITLPIFSELQSLKTAVLSGQN